MPSKPNLVTHLNLRPAQQRLFVGSCLPLTMKLAWEQRARIVPNLLKSPERWPYHDRVLCWIAPQHLENVVRFHDFGGPSFTDLRSADVIARLDVHYCARLADRVIGLRPGWTHPDEQRPAESGNAPDAV